MLTSPCIVAAKVDRSMPGIGMVDSVDDTILGATKLHDLQGCADHGVIVEPQEGMVADQSWLPFMLLFDPQCL